MTPRDIIQQFGLETSTNAHDFLIAADCAMEEGLVEFANLLTTHHDHLMRREMEYPPEGPVGYAVWNNQGLCVIYNEYQGFWEYTYGYTQHLTGTGVGAGSAYGEFILAFPYLGGGVGDGGRHDQGGYGLPNHDGSGNGGVSPSEQDCGQESVGYGEGLPDGSGHGDGSTHPMAVLKFNEFGYGVTSHALPGAGGILEYFESLD